MNAKRAEPAANAVADDDDGDGDAKALSAVPDAKDTPGDAEDTDAVGGTAAEDSAAEVSFAGAQAVTKLVDGANAVVAVAVGIAVAGAVVVSDEIASVTRAFLLGLSLPRARAHAGTRGLAPALTLAFALEFAFAGGPSGNRSRSGSRMQSPACFSLLTQSEGAKMTVSESKQEGTQPGHFSVG